MNRLIKALLLLNLEILLLAPMCVPQKIDHGVKSADQYWKETGLGSKELEALLAPESCQISEQGFLACVNAIGQMAEKYRRVLDPSGNFRELNLQDIEDRSSEKKDLSRWASRFESLKEKIPFLELWRELDENLIQPDERATIIAIGINGFLSVFKDPHTYIMPLAMYEEVIANSENRNTNAGFVARRQKSELVVRKVLEGSSAAKAGVKKGDRIISLNGEKVSDLLPSQINEILKMRNSDRLALEVTRQSKKKYLEILKSENIYPSVSSRMVNELGLVTIHKFSKNVCEMTRQQIISLKEQAARGVLFDLRDNPGGQVEEAACVINLFVDKGTLMFETRYLDASRPSDPYVADKDPIYKGPLAVLINSGSASASEIVAGSLRDLNRAKLIGERSFGKGSFQDGRIWGPNPKIALFETEGLYYFPSGWTPQLVGLQPDVQVNFNSSDQVREDELFLNPLVPIDSWVGPQSLTWLTERECP
ncbi:MAG: S41 family peptidase, partial [Pseudobdellovibrionaceae bacterium]